MSRRWQGMSENRDIEDGMWCAGAVADQTERAAEREMAVLHREIERQSKVNASLLAALVVSVGRPKSGKTCSTCFSLTVGPGGRCKNMASPYYDCVIAGPVGVTCGKWSGLVRRSAEDRLSRLELTVAGLVLDARARGLEVVG